VFGPKVETIETCPYCEEEITSLGEDALDYCPECEVIVEGEAITKEIEL
jgi:hypothetical protein